MAETGFSHRLTAYKIVGHVFELSYRKISGSNQVKNRLYIISNISVPCPHAQLRGHTVMKKFWTFFGPWGLDHSQSPPSWIFRVKQIHPSTGSARTTQQNLWYTAIKDIFFFVCLFFLLTITGRNEAIIVELKECTVEPAMSSHSYELPTSYGRPLGHSPKWHFLYKWPSYEQPPALKGHFSVSQGWLLIAGSTVFVLNSTFITCSGGSHH